MKHFMSYMASLKPPTMPPDPNLGPQCFYYDPDSNIGVHNVVCLTKSAPESNLGLQGFHFVFKVFKVSIHV